MSREWKELQPPICEEIVKTIQQLKFKHMTPVQVSSQLDNKVQLVKKY